VLGKKFSKIFFFYFGGQIADVNVHFKLLKKNKKIRLFLLSSLLLVFVKSR